MDFFSFHQSNIIHYYTDMQYWLSSVWNEKIWFDFTPPPSPRPFLWMVSTMSLFVWDSWGWSYSVRRNKKFSMNLLYMSIVNLQNLTLQHDLISFCIILSLKKVPNQAICGQEEWFYQHYFPKIRLVKLNDGQVTPDQRKSLFLAT